MAGEGASFDENNHLSPQRCRGRSGWQVAAYDDGRRREKGWGRR
eukprot:CAMPEP_0113243758 /NCGR_PEP_ID=MMETSP0008_2-20120614/8038_1 /TAXON_ID=97485 /ORGANISM="Prymnesium parvum" /LENGTH=43 /DNA_ID=CAMNT_0000091329 /DNA_START=86 /DNA_END=214 /DNA_ORIENTATION=- /assembly_acc=CAM_ASM_000153